MEKVRNMVFFLKKSATSRPPITSATIVAMAAVLTGMVNATPGGIYYPDFDVQVVSDRHIILKYRPVLSDDMATVGRVEPYILNGHQVQGRVALIATPPGGEIRYSISFTPAGVIPPTSGKEYISAETPLALEMPPFESRGHRFARLIIFPERLENGALAVYTDFVINVEILDSKISAEIPTRLSRLDSVLTTMVINPDQFYKFGVAARREAALKPLSDPFAEAAVWLKVAVSESGVTRITGAQLAQAGVSLTGLRSDSLRVFYSGGINPPELPSEPDLVLHQIAIRVVDGGDNSFASNDYLLFYAEAPSRYVFGNGEPAYVKNSYNDKNYYWLSIGGFPGTVSLRWNTADGTPTGSHDQVVTATRQPVRAEQDRVIKVDSDGRTRNYFDWFWSDNSDEVISVNLPNCVAGDSIDVRMAAITNYSSSTVKLNGKEMSRGYIGGDLYHFWDNTGAATPGINTFAIHLATNLGRPYLDYLDITYPMALHYAGRQMEFSSAGNGGYILYTVTGYSPSHNVLEITDLDNPVLVAGVEITVDTARFQRPVLPQTMWHYVVYDPTTLLSPASIDQVDPGRLRQERDQYDCIVVSPRRFLEALQEYATYRQSTGGYRVKLVAVEDIYDAFGYGLESPMAIRDYLGFAYQNFDPPAPFAVLLVGDGHYDFLDNLGLHRPSYIPPFIWDQESSAGDDNYVYFGRYGWLDSDSSYVYQADHGWDMTIARWPVRSPEEIAAHLESIKRYESPETNGSWRSRITFVADDEFNDDYTDEIIHTAQAETLAVFHTPAEFVKQKIYLTDYPFASNGEKPAATEALINAVNDGTLILNYIGHGSPDVWAAEHVLRKSRDLGRMTNVDKLTVVIAGSCSIGFFDDPSREGLAEMMFRQPAGGIETVSATRLVYATDNAIFNYDLYDGIFLGRLNVCEATYAAKTLHQYSYNYSLIRNDRSYVVFGDPLGRIGIPEYRLQFDAGLDSLMTPLSPFAFAGSVVDDDGNPAAVAGQLDISVYDSRIVRHHPLGMGVNYSLGGPSIFRGAVPVADGRFAGSFIVPLDIDYGGADAQIMGYGAFGGVSAIGGMDSLAIAMTASSTTDNSGPEIRYGFEEVPDFVSGDRIPPYATAVLEISDQSGINLTGGLGHRIELIIDNDNNTTADLTDRYTYASGSCRTGEIRFALPELSPQRHSFKIKAWDNANNPAMVEFEATPAPDSRLAVSGVMNWPNPMEENTEFFFELSETAEWVELQIFTLAGRMIKSFRADNMPVGRNRRFSWDGRDMDGDRVAQGVYIYKITAKGRLGAGMQSTDTMAEAFGKLIVLN